MTRKYEVRVLDRIVALGFVSAHPYLESKMVASVFPITRTADLFNDRLELSFSPMSHEDFSSRQVGKDMIRQLLAPVIDGALTQDCLVEEVDLRREITA